MTSEVRVCPYMGNKCLNYVDYFKCKIFWKCGDYDDFETEYYGINLDDVVKYVIEKIVISNKVVEKKMR